MVRLACAMVILGLMGCQTNIDIKDFDRTSWLNAEICSEEIMTLASVLENNEDKLQSLKQTEIESFLGAVPRHELSKRNEKFFYYPLTQNCDGIQDQSLLIRFDALGRAKEVMIAFD